MDAQKLAIPLLAFAGGAILGRVLGLKTLVRGAMTAAAVTGMTAAQPAIAGANGHPRRVAQARRRKPARRSAHKKAAAT